MSDIHLSRDLLAARSRGEVSSRELLGIALQHLSRHCAHCRDEILAWQRQRHSSAPRHFVDALSFLLCREEPGTVEERRRELNTRLRELLALVPEERERRVSQEPERFASPQLAWLLLETSRRKLIAETMEAENLADLAMLVLWYSPVAEDSAQDLLARAHAYSAACRHRQGDGPAADESFRAARHQVRIHGLTDSLLLAEIDALEGALRHDQRRLPIAVALLQRSALLYRMSHRPHRAARVLLRLSAVHSDSFQLTHAIDTTRQAVALLSASQDHNLLACGRHRLAWYLCDAGRYAEAELVALENAGLDERTTNPGIHYRQIWLQGRIAAGRARPRDAERALRIARRRFLHHGCPQAAALVTLDLVDLYHQQGREDDVRSLAEALPASLSGNHAGQREVLVALLTVQRAARTGEITPGLLRRLQRLLQHRFRGWRHSDLA